ncbi:MAG: maleate isomerase [Planctomycetota bacterium]|jgi:maleate isomerase
MVDSLGFRKKFGVLAPSTNTAVQPEYDAMAPHGVTNHFSRIIIPDTKVTDNDSFMLMLNNIRHATGDALDAIMSCSPDHVILGMSAEAFWDGKKGAAALKQGLEKRAGVGMTTGSESCLAALEAYGNIKRIGIVTPYMPVGDENVVKYFEDCGFEVVNIKGLKCASPMLISHVTKQALRDAIIEVNDDGVDAIIQAGTNLIMAEVAAMAEFWLDKPVIAINTATYWHALRQNGVEDKVYGFGKLLSEH